MPEPTRSASKTIEDLTNIEKAAIIFISLGRELTAQVMRYIPEKEIEVLTTAIARMQ
ncbi:MAG: flagellar motor switch protein FliG, partial [Candidatus Latescibacteria bacterium]|nr:flagellar motor switch protein FliG [Candidatus Latescibacterota bacterium]